MSYKFTDFLNKKSEKQLSKMTNQEIYYKYKKYYLKCLKNSTLLNQSLNIIKSFQS